MVDAVNWLEGEHGAVDLLRELGDALGVPHVELVAQDHLLQESLAVLREAVFAKLRDLFLALLALLARRDGRRSL